MLRLKTKVFLYYTVCEAPPFGYFYGQIQPKRDNDDKQSTVQPGYSTGQFSSPQQSKIEYKYTKWYGTASCHHDMGPIPELIHIGVDLGRYALPERILTAIAQPS
jgi:hypothetical protein